MLHSSSSNKFFLSNSDIQCKDPNLDNLPDEIKFSQQFCCWKYIREQKNSKPLKVPYGYSLKAQSLVPSLKDKRHWFTFNTYKSLNKLFSIDFGLGLVLINGPLTVIDIDNYQNHHYLDNILMNMLKKGCYIEVSPSGRGLHIFYKGIWGHKKNKGSSSIVVNDIKTTCEVYCGKDVRFITLTGQKISLVNEETNLLMPSTFDIIDDLSNLKKLFFESSAVEFCKNNSIGINTVDLNEKYLFLREKILESDFLVDRYLDLCKNVNTCYKSESEADWAFCLMIAACIPLDFDYRYQLLKYFFETDRPYRPKKNRLDYVDRTVRKALESFDQEKKTISQSRIKISKLNSVSKNLVIKICNVMNIFHLGKSIKDFKYISNKRNNSLKANIPYSLNQNDLVYYIELQDQYIKAIVSGKYQSNDYVPINISKILNKLYKSASGKTHKYFLNTVYKLSAVYLEYNKKMSKDGSLYSREGGSLLSYKYIYNNSSDNLEDSNKVYKKKLWIKMHSVIMDIVQKSNYNYAIFNKVSFDSCSTNKMRLLYYYFSLSTLPGLFSQKFLINDFLELWPKTLNKKILWRRKAEIVRLLNEFEKESRNMIDMDIFLLYEDAEVSGVEVKKRKLVLN